MKETSSIWQELPRTKQPDCPKLFYSFSTGTDSLDLKLTDLVAIWECSFERSNILDAAKAQHSSIDPSESNDQLRVLLDKLQQSLASGENYLFRAQDFATQVVHLKTTLDLPKPLKALSWTFELHPQDAGELAEQLLRPCLHEASVAKQKLASLQRVIKDKDHVLSRLLEKVESSAIDLSLIFPGITGLKSRKSRVTVREAQRHVPGMAEFDYDKWSSGFKNGSPYAGFDQMGMSALVAGCEKCPKHTVQQHCSWMKELPAKGTPTTKPNVEVKQQEKQKYPERTKQHESTDSDSDFERQSTPPHLKKSQPSNGSPGRSVPSAPPTSEDGEKRPTKRAKLGKVGGSGSTKATQQMNTSSGTRSTSPFLESRKEEAREDRKKSHTSSAPESDTETASEDDLSKAASARPSSPVKEPKLTASTRKLGKLQSMSTNRQLSSSPRSGSPADHPNSKAPTSNASHPQTRQSLASSSPDLHPSKLGRLRHKTQSTQRQQRDHYPPNQENDIDTASNSDSDNETLDRPKPPSDSKSNTNTTKTELHPSPRKLGRLTKHIQSPPGSNKATSSQNKAQPNRTNTKDEDTASTATATDTDSEADHEPKHKHSRQSPISNRAKNQPDQESPATSKTTTSEPEPSSKRDPQPVKEESAQEKADRRREELKRRLNAQSSGGQGAVKKRKF